MKQILVLIFFMNFSFVKAQFIEEIYAGIDFRYKCEIMDELLPTKYLKNVNICKDLDKYSNPIYFGLRFKNRYSLEFGYYYERYFAGYFAPNPIDLVVGGNSQIDGIYHYYTKFNYDIFKIKRINITTGISMKYGKSTYAYYEPLHFSPWFNAEKPNGDKIITYNFNEWKVDNGLHKYYLFVEASLKLEFEIYKSLYLTLIRGYNHGFKTMGYYRGYFKINDEPQEDIYNRSEGRHYFTSLGLKYGFRLKDSKDKPRSVFINRLMEKNTDFKIKAGVHFSLDAINDGVQRNHFISYGPSLKMSYGRIGLITSFLFSKRNINVFEIGVKTRFDNSREESSMLIINVKSKSKEIYQNLIYNTYYNSNMDLNIGLGYFILFISEINGNYSIKRDYEDNIYGEIITYTLPTYLKGLIPNVSISYIVGNNFEIDFLLGVKYIYYYQNVIGQVFDSGTHNSAITPSYNICVYYNL